MKLQKWYFTFGFGQAHENCYTVIEAENSMAARLEMISRYGRKWARQYNSAEEAGVDEYNLNLEGDCFFCEYARQIEEQRNLGDTDCTYCPGKLVSPRFDCHNKTYHWEERPTAFYKKIVTLHKKFEEGGWIMERPFYVTKEHLEFLDELRLSGETNMHGAGPYLMEEFGMDDHKLASDIVGYWMKSFGKSDR